MQQEHYKVAGNAMAYAIVHHGIKVTFLSPVMLEVLQNRSVQDIRCPLDLVPDHNHQSALKKVGTKKLLCDKEFHPAGGHLVETYKEYPNKDLS